MKREAVGAIAMLLAAGCRTLPYSPCPVELEAPLPADAFVRVKRVVSARYGALAIVDADEFLLQSGWHAVVDPPGQRRASVFRDRGDLAVVVEARSLVEPLLGLPYWGSIRGDAAAERDLAEQLKVALKP